MEPRIVGRDAFVVMGVVGHFSSAAEDFGPLWEEYTVFHREIEALGSGEGHYGVYLSADHFQPLYYLAGMAVRSREATFDGVEVVDVPAAMYAVFECSFQNIGATYGHIWYEWLDSSDYEQDTTKLGFDYFPPAMRGGASRMEVWFPVRARDR